MGSVHDDNDTSDPFAQLDERLDHPPLFWDAEKKAKDPEKAYQEPRVRGQVEELQERENENGSFSYTVIRTREGTRVGVSWWGTVLERAFKRYEIAVGDFVGVQYLGREPSNTPGWSDYANYDVVKFPGPAARDLHVVPDDGPDLTDADVPPDDVEEEPA